MMISLSNLTKVYKVGSGEIRAVDNINLEIGAGDFVSIVGHSGSGKTTLLSLIGGLTKPTAGTVTIEGTDIWTLDDREMSIFRNLTIGFMFQFASLIPTLNVLDNLLLPTFFCKQQEESLERARDLLDMVELTDKIEAYPSELSGGQQRRVAIARAFMNRPKIILADEPTGDLDEESEATVMELFRRMNREEGVTFVMVTHNKALAREAQAMLTMKDGKIVSQ
jgi:putative ABC transport system ATP-binding protein/lipoprotein-releasing system ATP-binding protein